LPVVHPANARSLEGPKGQSLEIAVADVLFLLSPGVKILKYSVERRKITVESLISNCKNWFRWIVLCSVVINLEPVQLTRLHSLE